MVQITSESRAVNHNIDWLKMLVLSQRYGETDDWNETVQAMIRVAMDSEDMSEITNSYEMNIALRDTCTCGAVRKQPFFTLWYQDVNEGWAFIVWANEHATMEGGYDEEAWEKYKYSELTETES